MALIKNIEVIQKDGARRTHDARLCTAHYKQGVYVQVETYSSQENRDVYNHNQNMRFEREGASQLLALIGRAFPDLLRRASEK